MFPTALFCVVNCLDGEGKGRRLTFHRRLKGGKPQTRPVGGKLPKEAGRHSLGEAQRSWRLLAAGEQWEQAHLCADGAGQPSETRVKCTVGFSCWKPFGSIRTPLMA